jgi:hypothetical protein
MTDNSAAKRLRLALYGPFVLLFLVAAGWSALWFYGRSRVNAELDLLIAREASVGRDWVCPNRSITGFPFRIEGRCSNPSYRQVGEAGEIVTGNVKAVTVIATTAGAFNLAHVISEVEGPLIIRSPIAPEVTANWVTARSSIRGSASRLERASIEIESPVVTAPGVGGGRWSAKRLEAHIREGVDPSRPDSYDIALRVDGASVPELDIVLKSADPVTLTVDARVLKLSAIDRKDWRSTIEAWRSNGGSVVIEQFALTKGPPRIEAKGEMRLDELRRVEGRLDANFVNAGALLQQFGIGGGVGGLVGGLLGGNRQNDGRGRDMTLRLPLVLDKGRVAIGPFRVPGLLLPPLF